jgi:hypothetical protein
MRQGVYPNADFFIRVNSWRNPEVAVTGVKCSLLLRSFASSLINGYILWLVHNFPNNFILLKLPKKWHCKLINNLFIILPAILWANEFVGFGIRCFA